MEQASDSQRRTGGSSALNPSIGLALDGMYLSNGTASTTGKLTNFTVPFYAGIQGSAPRALSLIGTFHFTPGETISFVNLSTAGQLQLQSNPTAITGGLGVTAGVTFELLRAGPPAAAP